MALALPAVTAEALFVQGQQLISEGRVREGCAMVGESQKLEPAGGTALALGLCLEQLGRTASAWAALRVALGIAEREQNEQRSAVARKHLAAVEPRLLWVYVDITPEAAAIPGLTILSDGLPLERPSWGVKVPVDAGEHRVDVSAPGRQKLAIRFEAREGEALRVITVGPLAEQSSPPPISSQAALPPPSPGASPLRSLGWAGLGAGGTSLLLGAFFGLRALSAGQQAKELCAGQTPCSNERARQLSVRSRDSADVATVTLVLGATLALGSGYLLRATAAPGGRAAGLAVSGVW